MNNRRVRLGNDHVELAFDSLTGEWLELLNKATQENVIKNWSNQRSMPFALIIRNTAGKMFTVTAPTYRQIFHDERLKTSIDVRSLEDGTRTIRIEYGSLHSTVGSLNIRTTVCVSIAPGQYETLWTIQVENRERNFIVEDVRFPCIFGVYMGETWEDDVLVYPFNSGEKTENPVEMYEKPSTTIGWKWQEYKYTYFTGAVNTSKSDDGAYEREFQYSGPLSMMWLDYYDANQGLYMASYDEQFNVAALHCETFGVQKPGMGFYAVKYPHIAYGQEWKSNRYAVALHPGDWHWGAERYGNWRRSIGNDSKVSIPQWFEQSPGLVAHYDFKYQGGDIVHRFEDLPVLYEQAKEMGVNHLLLSGWHVDGFDYGFPIYKPDPELGSEKEFIEQIQAIRRDGGHVTFYINSRLFNVKYTELEQLKNDGAVKERNGDLKIECYGDDGITFAVMCCNSPGWQQYMYDTVKYLVETVGADGMYFDQLGMAPPQLCFNDSHRHAIDSWNAGYSQWLDRILSQFDINILFEGVTDIHGAKVGGQLISTFFYHNTGAFPEMYRYTFPEQTLVDMVYPSKGQVMRPAHISQVSRDMIDRVFLIGCYFWVYDLEEDNTFRKDPELYAYLKQVIELRAFWLNRFGKGLFRDDTEMVRADPDVTVKSYTLECGDALLAVKNNTAGGRWSVTFQIGEREVEQVMMYQLGKGEQGTVVKYKYEDAADKRHVRIETESSSLAILHVKWVSG